MGGPMLKHPVQTDFKWEKMKMMQIKMQQMAIKMSKPHPCCLGAFFPWVRWVGGGGFFDGEILSLFQDFFC